MGLSLEAVAGEALRSIAWLEAIESGKRHPTADEFFDLQYALRAAATDLSTAA